jgi:hypothetical protein
VDGDPEALLALLVDPAAAEAVLCSHGELIGTVLERLGGRGLDTAGQLAWPKVLAGCWRWAAGGSSISRYLRRSASKTPGRLLLEAAAQQRRAANLQAPAPSQRLELLGVLDTTRTEAA